MFFVTANERIRRVDIMIRRSVSRIRNAGTERAQTLVRIDSVICCFRLFSSIGRIPAVNTSKIITCKRGPVNHFFIIKAVY